MDFPSICLFTTILVIIFTAPFRLVKSEADKKSVNGTVTGTGSSDILQQNITNQLHITSKHPVENATQKEVTSAIPLMSYQLISTSNQSQQDTVQDIVSDTTVVSEEELYVAITPLQTDVTTPCECGKSMVGGNGIDMRVVGGSLVVPYSYPWQAILQYYDKHICSATIISRHYLMTAGHCIILMKDFQKLLEDTFGRSGKLKYFTNGSIAMDEIFVLLGAYNTADLSNTVKYKVKSYLIHPEHTVDDVHDTNDIALVKLEQPITYTDHIQPVCLPKQGEVFSGHTGIIVGWGRTAFNGTNSQYLQHAKVHILSDKDCIRSKIGPHFSEAPETMICAYQYNTDACKGDSGGPLLYVDHSRDADIQVGIVSWGIGCAQVGYPGVYTEVSHYIDWMTDSIGKEEICNQP